MKKNIFVPDFDQMESDRLYHLNIILTELAKRVGLERYDYMKKKECLWTWSERERYREWLVSYLHRNPQARNCLINTKKSANNFYRIKEIFSKTFVLDFGFELKP